MTDQERQMIEALAKRIQDAPPPQIDRAADDLIRRAIGARTDALYILTQTVLIQEMALTQAKAQIDELKQRVPSPGAGSSSFLGSTSAERAPQPAGWAEETGVQRPGGYRGSGYQKSGYQEPQTPPQPYGPPWRTFATVERSRASLAPRPGARRSGLARRSPPIQTARRSRTSLSQP